MSKLEICRICLRTDAKMFNLNRCNLKLVYDEILTYVMNEEDGLPLVVCYECAALLQKYKKFREKCFLGQRILLEMKWKGPITYKAVKKIKHTNKMLEYTLQKKDVQIDSEIYFAIKSETDNLNFEHLNDDEQMSCDKNVSEEETVLAYPQTDSEEEDKLKNFTIKPETEDNDCEQMEDEQINCDEQSITENEKNLNKKEKPLSTLVAKRRKKKKQTKKNLSELFDPKHWKITILNQNEAEIEFKKRAAEGYFTRAAFKCMDCLKGFSTAEMLDRHKIRMHQRSNKNECEFCHMTFKLNHKKQKHVQGHYTRFQCLRCNTKPVFCLEVSAMLHNETHEDLTKTCVHCGKEFKHSSTLYTHLRQHRSQHVCAACGESFVSSLGLRLHNNVKHPTGAKSGNDETSTRDEDLDCIEDDANKKSYDCSTCKVKFSTLSAFRVHFFHSELHANEAIGEKNNVPIPKKKEFRKKTRAAIIEKLGIENENSDDEPLKKKPLKLKKQTCKPRTCRICGKYFDGFVKCMDHHKKEHPGMSFYDESQKIICEICGASLAPGSAAAHANAHSRAVLHACAACGRGFVQAAALRRHAVTHTGEKPWQCQACDKCFTQSNSLQLHHRTVHLKQPYPKRNRYKKKLMIEEGEDQFSKSNI